MSVEGTGVRGSLPPALTSFVGRTEELALLERLASDSRLVTVTGVGGIGKTRVALEHARHAATRYPDGAWFVDLAPLTTAGLLPHAVSTSLGLMVPPGGDALDGLLQALAERTMLLLLDNCEHLVESCAQLVSTLLTRCEGVRILATSREVLGISGETTWSLPPMPTPPMRQRMTLSELRGLESVQLFLERAEIARPGFRLADDNADTISRICRHLDGIPLAIELAAARTRTLPLAVIDERLDQRLALLTSQSRSAIPRQRTLQTTLDWSHDLLGEREQTLFRRLAVFRRGCSLEAAECVGSDGDEDDIGVLEVLAGLVDKSLVVLDDRVGRPSRYRLLEPVREYALHKLRDAGDLEPVAASHARYYLRFGEAIRDGLLSREQARWFLSVEDDLDNLRACFEWAMEHDIEAALRLTLDLERYWFFGRRGEVHDWLERSLAAASAPADLRAHALSNQSVRKSLEGDFDAARDLANACLDLARAIDSPLYEGKALMALGVAASEEHKDRVPDLLWSLYDQAEELIRSVGDPRDVAFVLNHVGFARFRAGNTEIAREKLAEGLELAREIDDVLLTGVIEGSLADAEMASGNRGAAATGWRRELELAGAVGSLVGAIEGLSGLGRLAAEDGDVQRSLTLVAAADEVLRQTGSSWLEPHVAGVAAQARAAAEGVLAPEEVDAAWERGARMSLAEAVAYAIAGGAAHAPRLERGEAAPSPLPFAPGDLAREGEYWTIRCAGRVARLHDSKGLRDIARLLAAPGTQIAAVDLAFADASRGSSPHSRGHETAALSVETGAGAALDAEARRQYRERLAELEEEVADAEAANDPERAAHARQEREFIVDELKAAVGLGGRDRRALDPAERARKAVTGRIRDAIARIEAVHPDFGQHLRRSIRTGAFCVYDPPARATGDR